ncbi:hypothetical protein F53441_14363 [Fusarium austroafricanum]|uniref:Uncharacterized protein n=1 Tax=Fusarium austroafricanum TaxID=2364996 RepID=A0A8H4JFK3_9HYPO|nr:hypothetical protein F53441_14363 [Fusarium austroafricanum]
MTGTYPQDSPQDPSQDPSPQGQPPQGQPPQDHPPVEILNRLVQTQRDNVVATPETLNSLARRSGLVTVDEEYKNEIIKAVEPMKGKTKEQVQKENPEVYDIMISYAFRVIGVDEDQCPYVFRQSRDYLAKTNVFVADYSSKWTGCERLRREFIAYDCKTRGYTGHVLTSMPDVLLSLIAVTQIPFRNQHPRSKGFSFVKDNEMLCYLHAAVRCWEVSIANGWCGQIRTGLWFVCVGKRY